MTPVIERHFATVGQRQVHYRRAGHGPPVILLHEAPRSSAGFEPLMRRLATRFTAIAMDTPGNGKSEPLGVANPTMSDFAHGLAGFLDSLGIARCVVYGYHTGAACTLEFARLYPGRVARAVVNGYLQLDQAFCADILANYFAPLSIDWSGSHLAWLWSRMKEQWSFFPWYQKTLAFRPPLDPPSAAELHTAVLEMLDAGDAYRDSYRAAFGYDAARTVGALTVPTLITTPRDDVLFPSLALMPRPAPCVRVAPSDDLAHAERMLESELALVTEPLPEPPPARTTARSVRPWSSYVRSGDLQLHLRRLGEGTGRPAVVQHSTVESARCVERIVTALAQHVPTIALDLPGRGLSDDLPAGEASAIEADADRISGALKDLGVTQAAFIGWRGGATVGLELAVRSDPAVHHLVALQPSWRRRPPGAVELSQLVPSDVPDTAGSHFLRAWHRLRDEELYDPWYERRLRNLVRHHEPDLEPELTQRRLEALFRCGPAAAAHTAASLAYPAFPQLRRVARPTLVGDASPAVVEALRDDATARCELRTLPQGDAAALAAVLLEFEERTR